MSELRRIVRMWREKAKQARKHKAAEIGDAANEAWRFYTSANHLFMFDPHESSKPSAMVVNTDTGDTVFIADGRKQLTAYTSVNLVSQYAAVYGPHLYYKNHVRNVIPRNPPTIDPILHGIGMYPPGSEPDQMVRDQFMKIAKRTALAKLVRETVAGLLYEIINYTPIELDLLSSAKSAILEAMVKGRGILWHDYYTPNSRTILPGSFFESFDNLLVDPEGTSLRDAKWVMRQSRWNRWRLERHFRVALDGVSGKPSGDVSAAREASSFKDNGTTYPNDLVDVIEVWSRMGIGTRLAVTDAEAKSGSGNAADVFGDYVYLVIVDSDAVDYPLNLTPAMLVEAFMLHGGSMSEVMRSIAWPIPYYHENAHPWPFTNIDFRDKPNSVWPKLPLADGMGYQRMLNWFMSLLASRAVKAGRDIVLVDEAFAEIKNAVLSGRDLEVVAGDPKKAADAVRFFSFPTVNQDVWSIIDFVRRGFDEAMGLGPLMYGYSPASFRSATEADAKLKLATIRLDDMRARVDEAMSRAAAKEAIAAQYRMKREHVMPILGQEGAEIWDRLVTKRDFETIIREYDVRVEAGSASIPNKDKLREDAEWVVQYLGPLLTQIYQATGDPSPLNAMLNDVARAREMPPNSMVVPPLRPPQGSAPPVGPPPPGPPPNPGPPPAAPVPVPVP